MLDVLIWNEAVDKFDPFEFDISAAADKKRRLKRSRRASDGSVETSSRTCDHPGCNLKGTFRAPKSPNQLDQFHWFCRKHVREYNLRWDYFKGRLTSGQSAPSTHEAKTGDASETDRRRMREMRAWQRLGIEDPYEILGDKGTTKRKRRVSRKAMTGNERKALVILEAEDCDTVSDIRKRYIAMVKIYHPDMNGGDRSEEHKLKEVVWAWEQIKDSRNFKA